MVELHPSEAPFRRSLKNRPPLRSPVQGSQFKKLQNLRLHQKPRRTGTRQRRQRQPQEESRLRVNHVRRRRWSGSLSQPIGFSRISLPRSEPQPVVEFAGDVSHPHLHAQRRPSSNAVQQKQGRKPPPQFLRDLSQIQLSPAPPREPQRERVPVK